MALSNYDSFVMNEKGEACKGEFVSPLGIKVKVYKDWLFVEDNLAWVNGGSFAKQTVMNIHKSDLTYKDVNIICDVTYTKHCDHTTLFCVWSGWEHKDELTGIIGVCQFGNIQSDAIDSLKIFLDESYSISYGNLPDVFKKLDLSTGKRFNQGDMFFHDKIGTDTQCTVPGENKTSIFSQLLGCSK